MQHVMDLWPGYQIAGVMRHQILTNTTIKISPYFDINHELGIITNWHNAVLITVVGMIIVLVVMFFKRHIKHV